MPPNVVSASLAAPLVPTAGPGRVVALQLTSPHALVTQLTALLDVGAVPLVLPPGLPPGRAAETAERMGASHFVTEREGELHVQRLHDPLTLVLEFLRKEKASDPYAFRFEPQLYSLRTMEGRYETAELAWTGELLSDLTALRTPRPDPVVLQRLGQTLHQFLDGMDFDLYEVKLQQAIDANREVQQCTAAGTCSSASARAWSRCSGCMIERRLYPCGRGYLDRTQF